MGNLMKTIVLKIHNPSARKKSIIEEAMHNYTLAFQFLLDKGKEEIKDIEMNYCDKNGMYSARSISKWVGTSLSSMLNEYEVEPFKDSLKIDFAATLAGHLNLIKTGQYSDYPIAYINSEELDFEYDKLTTEFINGDKEEEFSLKKINRLLNKSENLRPIFFCRYATNRNYCILYDPIKNKYFLKVYLMNSRNKNRKAFENNSKNIIRYMNENKELFKVYGKKEGFLILPLSFGAWQEGYLKQAFEKPATIKTARIFKKKNDYYISINIEMDEPKKVETDKFMSITRGLENTINYSIVNKSDVAEKYGFQRINNKIEINKLHKLANHLVELAENNTCQVIMEKLVDKGDRINWVDKNGIEYKPQLGCYEYNRLYDIIKYKLLDKGLPAPIRVSGIGIFYTCPRCGFNSKDNRFSEKILMCIVCGMTLQIEEVGSINLAMKLSKYSKAAIKIKSENTGRGIMLTNEDLGLSCLLENADFANKQLIFEINKIIKSFYENINFERSQKGFNKKYSIIKKIQSQSNVIENIKIV